MAIETLISVLLVEDEPLWQEGIKTLLSLDGRFQLVGIADTEETALAAYITLHPQVVLLDWKLADGDDGLKVGKTLEQHGHPPSQIILVSGSDPAIIPQNPYPFVPKPKIAAELLPTLDQLIPPAPQNH